MEIFLKVVFTLPLVITFVFSPLLIMRLWNTQIDVPKTLRLWLGEQLALSNWIVTRDQNGLYQEGRLVGMVIGKFDEDSEKFVFKQVRYVSFMDERVPLEFRHFSCMPSIKETVTAEGMETVSWYKDLECRKVKK